MTNLSGKHALVTGGGSGVGAVRLRMSLADAGCQVTITGRNASRTQGGVCEGHEAHPWRCRWP
jgi:NAD(P)-dependent dehydrogenase (short-subunit alcohol dehydrogenase family)